MTIILFFVTVLFTFMPWVLKSSNSSKWRASVLSLCTCLSGGVIVGSLLFHLIPETLIEGHTLNGAPILAFSELSSHACGSHDHHGDISANVHSSHDHHAHDNHHREHFQWGSLAFGLSFFGLLAIDRLFLAHRHCSEPSSSMNHIVIKPNATTSNSIHKACCASTKDTLDHHGPTSTHHHHRCAHSNEQSQLKIVNQHPSSSQECHSVNALGGCHVEGLEPGSSKVQSLFFVLALSVHSFVEGLAVQSISTTPAMFSFFVSLFSHKCLEALALGISVYKAKFCVTHSIILGLIYSFLTPLGIIISIGLKETAASGPILSAVINGLAAGSFLFVAVVEMIIPELHTYSSSTPAKFIVLHCGFFGMAAVSLFSPPHTH